MIHFDAAMREHFRASVKDAAPDRAVMASDAVALSVAWLSAVSAGSDLAFLERALRCKAAGYNADLYGWVIRASRAIEAADALLGDATGIDFTLPDLQLGEYFLLQRAAATGKRVYVRHGAASLEAALFATQKARCDASGFEPIELELNTSVPGTRLAPHARRLDVVAVASMETYLPPLRAALCELITRGKRCGLLVPRGALGRWGGLDDVPEGCSVVAIESIVDPHEAAQLEWEQASMVDVCERYARDFEQSLTYRGVSLWPLVQRDVVHMVRQYVPYVRVLRSASARFFREAGVRTLLCARLRRATDTTLAAAAQESGAAVCMVLHGHVGAEPERTFVDGDHTLADSICIWGEPQREVVAGKGAKPERIVVTGNPVWDSYRGAASGGHDRHALTRAVGCGDGDRVVALIGQPDALSQLGKIIEVAAGIKGLVLVCRPHPTEDVRIYERAIASLGNERTLLATEQRVPMATLLESADAVITLHSTVNLEAVACGTPVVTVALDELREVPRLVDLPSMGLPLVTSADELATCLRELVAQPQRWHDSVRDGLTQVRRAWGMDSMVPAAARVADQVEWCTRLAHMNQAEAA